MLLVRKFAPWLAVVLVALAARNAAFLSAEDKGAAKSAEPKPSSYAPIDDLAAQLDSFLESLESDLADPQGYGEYQQGRVAKDANTVAVLGLVIGKHDGKHKLQAAAPAVIKAARRLGDSADDYERAKAALEALKKAVAEPPAAAAEPPAWEPVADIQQLMQQVPVVNNSLRRGVTGRRFDRSRDKSAGEAATLAAIAQASMFDTSYCGDEESERTWAAICAEMRDAAAAVNRAVRKGDQETAKQGLARLVETCDACHDQFR